MAQNLRGLYYQINGGTAQNIYQYKVRVQQLLAQARLYYRQSCRLFYFAGGAAGIGFVHNSAVSMQPIPQPSGSAPSISSQASDDTHAAYALTAGVHYNLNSRWHFEAGFTQSFLGHDRIKMNTGTKTKPKYTKLNMGEMRPWQVWISVGYQF